MLCRVLFHYFDQFLAEYESRFEREYGFLRFDLYANAHRGKVRKAGATSKLLLIEEECPRISRRGCPETNRKIYEVDPLRCSQCQAQMRIIAFISNYAVVDRIINHLKLTFVAERPPPPHMVYQKLLMTAEPPADYFS